MTYLLGVIHIIFMGIEVFAALVILLCALIIVYCILIAAWAIIFRNDKELRREMEGKLYDPER